MILRKIARHCVEPTDGLFITLPEDDLNYQATFVKACREAGIDAEIIDPQLARRMEPSVNPDIIGAVKVPDGAVDPFRLTMANALDARAHGARILTYHEVLDLIREQGRVIGVRELDRQTGERHEYYAPVTVNAGGIWGHGIARMAGITINMFPAKGSLLIFGHRVNHIVLNRCRKPANADILVPGDTISLIGTTSSHVNFDEVDDMRVTPDEVDLLLTEGANWPPPLASTRILRAPMPACVLSWLRTTILGQKYQPRHRPARSRDARRSAGPDYHYGRQADDLPPDGRMGHRSRVPQARRREAVRNPRAAAPGIPRCRAAGFRSQDPQVGHSAPRGAGFAYRLREQRRQQPCPRMRGCLGRRGQLRPSKSST